MCFSATASFGAGIILTVIGVVTVKKVRHPSEIMFACIPFIFAVQQITEGVLWKTLPTGNYQSANAWFTYVFLFFAQILWPVWIPISILLIEKIKLRKNIQRVLVIAGVLVSGYLAYCMLQYPVKANIVGHHVSYEQNFPASLRNTVVILYALATVFPPFFSPIKRMWLLGLVILVSYIISAIFYERYVLSVWCFLATVISVVVYIIMVEIKNNHAYTKSKSK